MASGQVFHNVASLTWDGDDISGQSNRVEITAERPEVVWENFGDDTENLDAGARRERVNITAVYTEAADEACDAVLDAFEATSGGTEGTISIQPLTSGTTTSGVGKILSINRTINKGEVGMIDFSIGVNGGLSRS